MIDVKILRNQPELVKAAIQNKGSPVDLDLVLKLDREQVALQRQVEKSRTERNRLSATMKSGKPEPGMIADARALRENLAKLETELDAAKVKFWAEYKKVPNIPTDDTPLGLSEEENQVARVWGKPPEFKFAPKNHYEISLHHDWIDKQRAAKVAGARFAYLKGDLVRLQFALIGWVLDKLADEAFLKDIITEAKLGVSAKPFLPVLPPYMIRTNIYDAMDRLEPADERYRIEGGDQWLQGSAEHVLGSMHVDEIFEEKDMPIRYLGYATSFRREAGSAGKDMEGIIRLHQFDKLEMESFSTKETSHEEHLLFSAIQERFMQLLEIPYRKLQKCTYDIGKPNAKGSDIEAWLPGQGKYRETHTADYMTDYQARRLGTRVRRSDGQVEYVHTNDATAFACGRALVAIIENFQNADMSVRIPAQLQSYMGGRLTLG
ncbi:serine--tRNA ligase [Agrobacterium rhizogenes]|nr:serine--tRNA ligase [Rhizobium rhizogenes]